MILNGDQLLSFASEVYYNKILAKFLRVRDSKSIEKRNEMIQEAGKEFQIFTMFYKNDSIFKISTFFSTDFDLYGYCFWKKNYSSKTSLCKMAETALQLMSLAAGESSCERSISKCRWITGDHKTNESERLTAARLLAGISADSKYGNHQRRRDKYNYW